MLKKLVLLVLICGCSEDIVVAELDPMVMRRPSGLIDSGMVLRPDAVAQPDMLVGVGGMAGSTAGGTGGSTVSCSPPSGDPRRAGVCCETDEQCNPFSSCFDGICLACAGPQCGKCAPGGSEGQACPVRGGSASACSFCAEVPERWCDADGVDCPTGVCAFVNCL